MSDFQVVLFSPAFNQSSALVELKERIRQIFEEHADRSYLHISGMGFAIRVDEKVKLEVSKTMKAWAGWYEANVFESNPDKILTIAVLAHGSELVCVRPVNQFGHPIEYFQFTAYLNAYPPISAMLEYTALDITPYPEDVTMDWPEECEYEEAEWMVVYPDGYDPNLKYYRTEEEATKVFNFIQRYSLPTETSVEEDMCNIFVSKIVKKARVDKCGIDHPSDMQRKIKQINERRLKG